MSVHQTRSSLLFTVLALCMFCCGANHAVAKKPNGDSPATNKSVKKKGKKKTENSSSAANAERNSKKKPNNSSTAVRTKKKTKRKPNMPPGWSWPPTQEMTEKGAKCLKQLTQLGVTWKTAKARRFITTPIVVPSMDFAGLKVVPTFRKGPFVMDCHLALSITKVAPALLQAKVRALRFSSIHSVRKVRVGGKRKQTLSRHALGLAIDVYEIAPTSGPILIVKKHYHKRPLASKVEQLSNESNHFRMVLSPANDPRSHYDHLHFEASVGDKKRRIRRRGKGGQLANRRKAQRAKKQRAKKQRAKKQRAKKQRAKKQRAKKQRAKKQRAKKQREKN